MSRLTKGGKSLLIKPRPLKQQTCKPRSGELTGNLTQDCEQLRQLTGTESGLEWRLLYTRAHHRAALFYYAGMIDLRLISQGVIRPLQQCEGRLVPDTIAQTIIAVPAYSTERTAVKLASALAGGQAVLLCDGYQDGLILDVTKVTQRSIERAASEDVLMGPHDSFSESLGTNLALLRSRLSSPNLKHRLLKVGKVSATDVAVVFIAGIVNEKLVDEVLARPGRRLGEGGAGMVRSMARRRVLAIHEFYLGMARRAAARPKWFCV